MANVVPSDREKDTPSKPLVRGLRDKLNVHASLHDLLWSLFPLTQNLSSYSFTK